MSHLNRRAFARGVDEALTFKPLRRAFWAMVSKSGYHITKLGRWLWVVGRWRGRR